MLRAAADCIVEKMTGKSSINGVYGCCEISLFSPIEVLTIWCAQLPHAILRIFFTFTRLSHSHSRRMHANVAFTCQRVALSAQPREEMLQSRNKFGWQPKKTSSADRNSQFCSSSLTFCRSKSKFSALVTSTCEPFARWCCWNVMMEMMKISFCLTNIILFQPKNSALSFHSFSEFFVSLARIPQSLFKMLQFYSLSFYIKSRYDARAENGRRL